LRHVKSQGYGDAIVFTLKKAADILEAPYDEILTDAIEGKIITKKFGTDPIMWRVTTNEILTYYQTANIFTKN